MTRHLACLLAVLALLPIGSAYGQQRQPAGSRRQAPPPELPARRDSRVRPSSHEQRAPSRAEYALDPLQPSDAVESQYFAPDEFAGSSDPYFGSGGWDDCSSCGPCETGTQMHCGKFIAGFAFTFLVPEFGDNIAFTTTNSDGATFERITPTQFDYGLKTSPRVWLEYVLHDGLGARVRYWQFNHGANTATGSPPANGFGQITIPPFRDIDISTNIPGDTITANSGLELQALDLEGTKGVSFDRWSLAASAGVRYGAIKQNYQARQRGANGQLQGSVDFDHNFDGVGPTFALEARRFLLDGLSIFSNARGSLLFGNLRSTLEGGEDLDLSTPFTTSEYNRRLDTLPVVEMQIGLDWQAPLTRTVVFFSQIAMEAQWWQGVGSAASETGDLGLFGFNTAAGIAW